jgi:3'-phosphoadenosine 5'-phosphosulfate sulfotransferase (PAPS reductase)/FAD synthetase
VKNYLSFGGGVNSVAMYLHLVEQGVEFEAVFVNHHTDWPETYEYVEMFRKRYPLTVIEPQNKRNGIVFNSLYDVCWHSKMFPSRPHRWCTKEYKRNPLNSYQDTPSFVFIGFDFSERHRAKIFSDKGREFRYPLIEAEITRADCKRLIKKAGLPIPMKSGCYICPFQRKGQLKELRRRHPELFCKLEKLEARSNEERIAKGLEPYYSWKVPVAEYIKKSVESKQKPIFAEDEFPPCECFL